MDNRDPAVLASWRERDPIKRYGERLVDDGTADADGIAALDARAHAEVEDAIAWALEQPAPEPETALEDVYAPAGWTTPGRLS
jgi:pyruvate dehydrogenase E1 component alpha subunit